MADRDKIPLSGVVVVEKPELFDVIGGLLGVVNKEADLLSLSEVEMKPIIKACHYMECLGGTVEDYEVDKILEAVTA